MLIVKTDFVFILPIIIAVFVKNFFDKLLCNMVFFIGHLTMPPTRTITAKFSFLIVIILNKAQKRLVGWVVWLLLLQFGVNSRLAAFFISYFER